MAPAPGPQQECSMSPAGKHVARHARPSAPGRRLLPSRPAVLPSGLSSPRRSGPGFLVRQASCISIWSVQADPRWPRALFPPRTPAALHSTPHSVGPPPSLTPRVRGRWWDDPRAGGITQQKGARVRTWGWAHPALGSWGHQRVPFPPPCSWGLRRAPGQQPPGKAEVRGLRKGHLGRGRVERWGQLCPASRSYSRLSRSQGGRLAGFPASRRATRYFQIKGIPGAPHHSPWAAVGSTHPLSPTGGPEQFSHSVPAQGPRRI